MVGAPHRPLVPSQPMHPSPRTPNTNKLNSQTPDSKPKMLGGGRRPMRDTSKLQTRSHEACCVCILTEYTTYNATDTLTHVRIDSLQLSAPHIRWWTGTCARMSCRGPWSLGSLNLVDYFPPGSQVFQVNSLILFEINRSSHQVVDGDLCETFAQLPAASQARTD